MNPSAEFLYFNFYAQFKNSLLLTLHANLVGVNLVEDPILFTKLVSVGNYPRGFFLISWLISWLGLQKPFLVQPYHLIHGLIVVLMFLPLLFNWGIKRVVFYYVLVFFFPITQIMLKGLNIESGIIIFLLFATFCYRSFLIESNPIKLILFVLFTWLAIIIKHLGLLYAGTIFLAIFIWRFLRKEFPIMECVLCILVLALSLPFYPENSMEYFVWVVEAHSEIISFELLTLLSVIGFIGIFLLSFFLRRKQGEKNIPLPKISLAAFLICFFFSQFFPVFPLEQLESLLIGVTILCLGFLILVFGITFYDFKSRNGLLLIIFLLTFSIASFLYFAHIAKTIYILFLPLLILLVLVVESLKSITKAGLLCIFFIIYSNFFPSEKFLHKISALINSEYTFQFYRNLFNSLDQSPLNWQKSHVPSTRKMLAQIFELYKYPEDYYENGIVVYSNDFNIKDFFYFPSFEYNFPELETNTLFDIGNIEEIPTLQPIKLLVDRVSGILSNAETNIDFIEPEFRNWISDGLIPVIILDNYGKSKTEDNLHNLNDKDEILSVIMKFYGSFLRSNIDSLESYNVHQLNFVDESYNIFIHKSIELRDISSNPKNHYLWTEISELRNSYK